jgi:hypothetical protein
LLLSNLCKYSLFKAVNSTCIPEYTYENITSMKIKQFILTLTAFVFCIIPKYSTAQAPNLGTAADFILFTSVGAVTNAGTGYLTLLTGNVGTNSAPTITGFGNVDGQMHYVGGPQSVQASSDLNTAYLQLDAAIPTFIITSMMGNGQILVPGVYDIASPATLDLDLSFDAQGDSNAVFIVKIGGAFSSSANSKVKLLNGAQSCNIFWKIEGMLSLASGTFMRGTLVVNNAAIDFAAADTLDGRALSTTGAITLNSLVGAIPIGCGSPILNGPAAPNLSSAACFALFSGIGPVTDNFQTFINGAGDIGNDGGGVTTGFDPLKLTGAIHSGDISTAAAAADLTNAYNYMNSLPTDIQLLFPALFGHNLVLTPHTYLLSGAVTFTDTLYLNAQGNVNAVFVINVDGAFSTSTFSNVILINGAQARNVYWNIDGAVDIAAFSVFNGTIILQGAVDLREGVVVNGRVLTGVGAVNTTSMTVNITPGCAAVPSDILIEPIDQAVCLGDSAIFGVSATGIGLTYQWRKGDVNLVDGGNISGATTDTLIIFPVTYADTGSNYNLVIGGSPNDTSIYVSLTIIDATSIDTAFIQQPIYEGNTATFTVFASGAGLSYQWRKGTLDILNGGNISGANASVMTMASTSIADTASDYNVIVFGTCGNDTSENIVFKFDTLTIFTIELATFSADWGDNGARLYWATESETDNDFFSVERCVDGLNFELIAEINGAGNSREYNGYEYNDGADLQKYEWIYYRLKQTDFDGKFSYSDLVVLQGQNNKRDEPVHVYPNPAKDIFNVALNGLVNDAEVAVFDIIGQLIIKKQVKAESQILTFNSNNWEAGIYIIVIKNGDKHLKQRVLIVK